MAGGLGAFENFHGVALHADDPVHLAGRDVASGLAMQRRRGGAELEHFPGKHGAALAAGGDYGIMPYGTEAMSTLRIEKGHIVVGAEADGRTTADDLGLEGLVSRAKPCIGGRLRLRAALASPERWQLVGLVTLGDAPMPRAAKIVADPDHPAPNPALGHVTSWCRSPNLETWIALALLADGRERHGQTLWAVSPLADVRVEVRVGPPCFIDPKGEGSEERRVGKECRSRGWPHH